MLLFMLAAYVAVVSVMTLLGHSEAKISYLGIAILIAATAIMPLRVPSRSQPASGA